MSFQPLAFTQCHRKITENVLAQNELIHIEICVFSRSLVLFPSDFSLNPNPPSMFPGVSAVCAPASSCRTERAAGVVAAVETAEAIAEDTTEGAEEAAAEEVAEVDAAGPGK